MAELTSDISAEVLAACQEKSADVAQALSSALDSDFQVEPVGEVKLDVDDLPSELQGPGLAMACQVHQQALVMVLPGAGGLLPDWCLDPSETEQSRLSTLALEVAASVLPEACVPEQPSAGHVDDLAAALQDADLGPEAVCVSLKICSEDQEDVLSLIWPARCLADEPTEESAEESPSTTTPQDAASDVPSDANSDVASRPDTPLPPTPPTTESNTVYYRNLEEGLDLLPPYSRSLLKVKVPVRVTLASTKSPVHRILELSPGSIIQFNKPCDDKLTLELGDQPVAVGEAVKVGDKFGLWITSIAMPGERFWVLGNRTVTERAK